MSILASDLLGALVRVSVEGGMVVALVALLVRAVPRMPAWLRCGLWWTACLKLAAGLVLTVAGGGVELTLLPRAAGWIPGFSAREGSRATPSATEAANPFSERRAPTAASSDEPPPAASSPLLPPAVGSTPTLRLADSGEPARSSLSALSPTAAARLRPTLLALAASWLLGVALMAGAALPGRARLARRLREATPVEDAEVLALLDAVAGRFGVAAPALRVTGGLVSPQLAGVLRPYLLLPRRALEAGRRGELHLVLAHELAHLRRRDLLLGWVPALARTLFFFHPLAGVAVREYALAREAACDAEVLRVLDAAPRDYGRMLLHWGAAVRRPLDGGPLAATLGQHRHLKRRLTMLDTPPLRGRTRPALALLAAVPVLIALAPVRLVAAPDAGRAAGMDAAASAPAPPPAATAASAAAPSEPAPPVAPVTRIAAADAPAAPAQAKKAQKAKTKGSHSYVWSDDDGEPMLYLRGDSSVGWHGDHADRVRALRRGDEPLLWFVRDGEEYVVRDRALLERVDRLYAPVMKLGREQGELGGEQGELGGRQGELGGEQGELGAQQGRLGAEQAKLAAEIAALAAKRVALELDGEADEAAIAELERREEELETKIEALGDRQRELGERQRDLGEQQRELGALQRELGDRQRELGERQRAASAEARRGLDRLMDEAITSGSAERVD